MEAERLFVLALRAVFFELWVWSLPSPEQECEIPLSEVSVNGPG